MALGRCLFCRFYVLLLAVFLAAICLARAPGTTCLELQHLVGVGMGLVVAYVPAALLLSTNEVSSGPFRVAPPGPILYLAMLLRWTAAMYGYLATGAK